MKLTVITPVGPGHERWQSPCRASVRAASKAPGPFTDLEHMIVLDEGPVGRSKLRNAMMRDATDTDWFFFLDADDEMASDALHRFGTIDHVKWDAVIGAAGGYTSKGITIGTFNNSYPVTSEDLCRLQTPLGLFALTGFFRAAPALDILFNEESDTCESFEFMCAFAAQYRWTKISDLMTWIHCERASAKGPRGYVGLDWIAEITPLFNFWKRRGFEPLPPFERQGEYWK
ncbi:MAG: hypothetical protein ACI88C_000024 [Acidimicrobiales bacterium]